MELGGVKEDVEVVGSRGFYGGGVERDGVVVKVDYAGFGSGLEGLELQELDRVGGTN